MTEDEKLEQLIKDMAQAVAGPIDQTHMAMAKAIEAVSKGALASDRQLLSLITALIDRVNELEAIEERRAEQYISLVKRQKELVELADKAIKELEQLGRTYFQNQRGVH